jgi:hypothetical protein
MQEDGMKEWQVRSLGSAPQFQDEKPFYIHVRRTPHAKPWVPQRCDRLILVNKVVNDKK